MKIKQNKADFFIISSSKHYENQIERSGLFRHYIEQALRKSNRTKRTSSSFYRAGTMEIKKNKADLFIISASRHYANQIEHSRLLHHFIEQALRKSNKTKQTSSSFHRAGTMKINRTQRTSSSFHRAGTMKIKQNIADFSIISSSRHYEYQIEHRGLLHHFIEQAL